MFHLCVNSCEGIPEGLNPYVKVITIGDCQYYIGKTKIVEKSTNPQFDPENKSPYIFHFSRAHSIKLIAYSHNRLFPDKKIGTYEFPLNSCIFNTPVKATLVPEPSVNSNMSILFTVFTPKMPLPRKNVSLSQDKSVYLLSDNLNVKLNNDITMFLTYNPPMPPQLASTVSIYYVRVIKPYGSFELFSSKLTTEISETPEYAGPSGPTQVANFDTKWKFPIAEYGSDVKGNMVVIPFIYSTGQYQGTVVLNFALLSNLADFNSKADAFDCRNDSENQYITLQEIPIPVSAPGAYSSSQAVELQPVLRFVNISAACSPNIEALARNMAQSYLADTCIAFRRFIWIPGSPFKMSDCLKANGKQVPSKIDIELVTQEAGTTVFTDIDYKGFDSNNSRCVIFTQSTKKTIPFKQLYVRQSVRTTKTYYMNYKSTHVGFDLTKLKDVVTKLVFNVSGMSQEGYEDPYVIVFGDKKEIFSLRIPYGKKAVLTMTRPQGTQLWDMEASLI